MKWLRPFLVLVALFVLAAGLGTLPANAQDGGKSKPNLKFTNRPLHGRNGTLKGGDLGDGDTIDAAPNLSALCQSYLGGPNPYANPAPNVDQIVNDATVTVGSQTGCSTAQNETTIVVNPNNPKNLVGGTNDYRFFNAREGRFDGSGLASTSFDGGATWINPVLPGLTYQTGATGALSDMDSAGDPALAFGPNNTVYYANLVFSRSNNGSGITVSRSNDGGKTWDLPAIVRVDGVDASGNPTPTNFSHDKEWIGVDPVSGKLIVTWTLFTFDNNGNYVESPIVGSVSSDLGHTWSPMFEVSRPLANFKPNGVTPFNQGSYPQFGKDGKIYVAYESSVCLTLACNAPTDHDAIALATSADFGKTWDNMEINWDYDFPFNPDVGRETLTGENFRINSFPSFAIDQQTGRMYITWADDRNGQYDPKTGASIKTNGDVFVVTSANGKQWSQPYRLGTDADEVYPGVAAYNGRVAVSFYTRHWDPNGINLDFAYVGGPGLGTLNNNNVVRITTQSENPQVQFVSIGAVTGQVLQGVFIGDYTAVALGSDLKMHPSWTDFRGKPGTTLPNQDAYSQSIQLK